MNARSKIVYISVLTMFSLLSIAGLVFAHDGITGILQNGIVPRDPDGSGQICNASGICTICDAWHFADHIITFLLFGMAVPVLTVVLLSGGALWVSSRGNPGQITKGKTVISTALLGFVFAFGGWLFVDTVIKTLASSQISAAWNKFPVCANITTLSSQAAPVITATLPGGEQPPPGQPAPSPIGGTVSNAEGYNLLQSAGIAVVSSGNCSDPNNSSCTSLEQMPAIVISKLRDIKNSTGIDFRVTGGTETGHQTHGLGLPVVDFKPESGSQADYQTLLQAGLSVGGQGFCETRSGGNDQSCNPSGSDTTDHIHMSF